MRIAAALLIGLALLACRAAPEPAPTDDASGVVEHVDADGRLTRVVHFERGSIVAQEDYQRSIVWRLEPADSSGPDHGSADPESADPESADPESAACVAPLIPARETGPSGQRAVGCVGVTATALLKEGHWVYRDAAGAVIASGEFREGRRTGEWILTGRDGTATPVSAMPPRGPLVLDEIFPDP